MSKGPSSLYNRPMIIKIFIYLGSLFITLQLLNKYQEKLHSLQEKIQGKLRFFFPFSEFKEGQAVRDYLTHKLSNPTGNLPPVHYKFYANLASEVATSAQRFGIPQTSFLKSLRAGLIQDLKFERKIAQELKAGFTQCLFIMIITWFFILFSISILSSQLPLGISLTIIALQVSGFFVFSWFFRSLKQKIFNEYGAFFSVLFRLKGLLLVGHPLGQALQESGHTQLKLNSKKFHPLLQQLETSLVKLQTKGVGIQDDLDHLIDELWFQSDLDFEQFMKQLFALKLMIILIFYFSSYFLYLISLLSTFVSI